MNELLWLKLKTDALLSSAIQGLLRMKILPRLRYILEVVRPSPPVVQDVLEVLTRICRHSSSSATQVRTSTTNLHQHKHTQPAQVYPSHLVAHCLPSCLRLTAGSMQVLDCPRLMEVLLSEFLPSSWAASSSTPPQSLYGLPLAAAVKLLRVVATSGRHACARVVSVLTLCVGVLGISLGLLKATAINRGSCLCHCPMLWL